MEKMAIIKYAKTSMKTKIRHLPFMLPVNFPHMTSMNWIQTKASAPLETDRKVASNIHRAFNLLPPGNCNDLVGVYNARENALAQKQPYRIG